MSDNPFESTPAPIRGSGIGHETSTVRLSERPIGDLAAVDLREAIAELDSDIAEFETERDMASGGAPEAKGEAGEDDGSMQDFDQVLGALRERKAACLKRLGELEQSASEPNV